MSEPPVFAPEVDGEVTVVVATRRVLVDPRIAVTFETQLTRLLAGGAESMVIDLDGVERMSSVFLRSLISAGRFALERHASLCICCTSAPVLEVLVITGLDKLFALYESRDEALAGARTPRP